jgi:hypothetical protein
VSRYVSHALALVLLASPLTDVFLFRERLPVAIYVSYAIAGMVLGVVTVVRLQSGRFPYVRDAWYQVLLMFLIFICAFSYLAGAHTAKLTQYLLWFSGIFVVYGLFGKWLMEYAAERVLPLLALEIAIFVTAILGLQDCAVRADVVFSDSWVDVLLRRSEEFGGAIYGVPRLRSTAEEGAAYALYLNIFVPLTLMRARVSRAWLATYGSVVVVAYVLTFSLAAWANAITAGLLGYLIVSRFSVRRAATWFVLVVVAAAIFYIAATQLSGELFERITDLEDLSWVERLVVNAIALDRIMDGDLLTLLLGYGPGSFNALYERNPLSSYLLVAHDLGVPSLLAIAMIFGGVLLSIRHSSLPTSRKWLLCVSVLSAMLHYAVIPNIWHPWIWLAFALILTMVREEYCALERSQ